MAAYKSFTLRILAVFVFILLTVLTTVALAQEETTETSEMNQSGASEENKYVSQTHTIVLINNVFSPEITEVNQYDTVVWRNLNKPKRSFVLVSEDNLWEDFTLGYGKSFEYTFNETGNFDFSIQDERDLEGTVMVSESAEATGAPLSEKETLPLQEETERQEEEEVTSAPIEEVTPTPMAEDVQSTENSVVIRESVFYPETLEIGTGETVVWKNLNKPKRSLTLVSEEGLFENLLLGYGRSFSYTFNDAGEYTFKLDETPGTELTVTVK